MSRILIDILESQMQALVALVQMEGRPRTAIIRDAVEPSGATPARAGEQRFWPMERQDA